MQVQLKKQHSRYSKYKHTGIPWLGEVPEEWNVNQLKRLTNFVSRGNSPDYSDEDTDYLVINQACIYWNGLRMENVKFHKPTNFKAKKGFLKKNDLAMNSTGTGTLGRLALINEEKNMIADGHVTIIRCKKWLHPRFLLNLLSTGLYQGFVYSYCVSGSTNQIELSGSRLVETPIVLPPKSEQDAIANYLDEKSALIEHIIQAKQRQVELLKEKRSALINRAVTKGIRTKVMFDTNAFDQWRKLSKKDQDKLLERVEIIYTHIQEDELPSDLRGVLPSAEKVSTSGAIFDISRYDHCTYGGEEDSSNISAVVGSGKKENHNKDALIANTAKMQSYLLITDDQRLQKKCNEIGGEAIPFKEFIARFEMKDSGVEWIGEIPQKWNVRKLIWNAKKIGSGTTPKSGGEEFYDNGEINWIITGDLNDGFITESSKKITKQAFLEHSALKMYPENSVVMAMYGATIGKLAITKIEACTNQACCVIQSNKNMDFKFCYFWLLGNRKNIINLAYGGGQPNISQDTVRNLRMPTPSIEEQKAVVSYLESEGKKIDFAVERIDRSIGLLREYKTSLISSAVTGKIKVTYEK